ncbi:hypothetical protein [Sphingomonas sp.]|jgi:hypothetical protein|nr:hypothetical protein [Sphingomonas sp.]MDF2493522.1 hypothetical protein [Sphingomonas sp.]
MREYLITISTATLAALLLQFGSPPAPSNAAAPVANEGGAR